MSYKPDPNADIFGTSLVEEIEVAPAHVRLSIGSDCDDVADFKRWLLEKVGLNEDKQQ